MKAWMMRKLRLLSGKKLGCSFDVFFNMSSAQELFPLRSLFCRMGRREMPGGHFLLPSETMGEYEEPVSENDNIQGIR